MAITPSKLYVQMITAAPRIETERLILRAFDRSDLDEHAATLADVEVNRFLGRTPATREESWRKLMMAIGQWPLLGYGYWAVETKADGRMVGQIGFCDFARDMEPDISGAPEMGWIFDPSVHGQGIAGEAGLAALEWIDRVHAPASIPAIISPGNVASIRLAEKLGFERVADGFYHDEPIGLFYRRR